MILRIKNWTKFQHYSDRKSMPWIKLHNSLLDDRKFMSLPDASKWLAIQLWLLASEGDIKGQIEGDIEDLAFRTRKEVDELSTSLNLLIDKGFIEDASNVLAECYQVASLDKIRRDNNIHHASKPLAKEKKKKSATEIERPSDVEKQVWDDFVKHRKKIRADITVTALTRIKNKADSAGLSLNDVLTEIVANGWRGFEPEWIKKDKKKSSGGYTDGVELWT